MQIEKIKTSDIERFESIAISDSNLYFNVCLVFPFSIKGEKGRLYLHEDGRLTFEDESKRDSYRTVYGEPVPDEAIVNVKSTIEAFVKYPFEGIVSFLQEKWF